MTHRLRINLPGLSAITFAALLLIVVSRFFQPANSAVTFWVLVWAALENLINFSGLSWSLNRSNKAFYGWFFGGSMVRLASLGVVALLATLLQVSPAAPLISLAVAYFILSMVQLPFLNYGLR